MPDFHSTTWGQVVGLQRGFDITKNEQFLDGNVPVVSSGGVSSFHNRSMSSGPGVVIGRKGTLGRVHWIDGPFWPHDTTLWVNDFKGSSPRFVYYALRSLDPASLNVGSASPTLNRNHIYPLPTLWPSELSTQLAIADVLGALDEKIAAHSKVLRLADEMIRTQLGKLNGPTVPLGQFASNVRIQVNPMDVAKGEVYVGLEHIPRRLMWLGEYGRADSVSSAKGRFKRGDILFGKLRPYFHKVVHAPAAGIASTDIVVIRANDPALSGFVLACASSDRAVQAATAASEGTRMPRTKWADLAAVEFPWPSDQEVAALSVEIGQFSNCAAALIQENERLAVTRDELLPLLMSGRIAVRDAEEVVGAAT